MDLVDPSSTLIQLHLTNTGWLQMTKMTQNLTHNLIFNPNYL